METRVINKEIMKSMKKNALILALIQVVIAGVLCLFSTILPAIFMIVIGAIVTLVGVVYLFILIKTPKEVTSSLSFIFPILIIALGIYILLNPVGVISTIAILVGIGTIIKGITSLLIKNNFSKYSKISGIISIILGIFIVLTSGSAPNLISYYIAISLVYHAIIQFLLARDMNKLIKSAGDDDDIVIEI